MKGNGRDLTVGFIGLGAMGLPMVERLLATGWRTVVWNRTRQRCERVLAKGARWADTPAQLMRQCDLVGLCLSDGQAVEGVALGEGGLFATSTPRTCCIVDFSTADPAVEVALSARAQGLGIGWLDCPVSGGVPAAAAGTLVVFAGGTADDLALARPLLDSVSTQLTHMGAAGAGQLAKLCNQVIVASNVLVIAEAIATARALGIDVSRLPAALAGGFADSKPLQIFGPRMVDHAFLPRLGSIRLMRKDVHLALSMGARKGAQMPMLAHSAQMYDCVGDRPDMSLDDDISCVIRLFERSAAEAT